MTKRRRGGGLLLSALLALAGAGASAEGPPFDYWILSLSWSPEYCSINISDVECREPYGFVVHGLWPQRERGRPSRCGDRTRVPKELVLRMLPLMPSERLIQHEWREHGSCSGLEQPEYFDVVERVRRKLAIPAAYQAPSERLVSNVGELKRSFLAVNPDLEEEDLALKCRSHWLSEVRVCFDPALNPRTCGRDIVENCGSELQLRALRR